MNTTTNEWHIAIGFLKMQTSPISVEEYVTEQKTLMSFSKSANHVPTEYLTYIQFDQFFSC